MTLEESINHAQNRLKTEAISGESRPMDSVEALVGESRPVDTFPDKDLSEI